MPFVKALAASELKSGEARSVEIAGKKIGIFNVAGNLYAIDDLCTHDEASLAEGFTCEEDGTCKIECPWHGAQFDLKTGAALTLPATKPVKTYAVRVNGDAIEVDA